MTLEDALRGVELVRQLRKVNQTGAALLVIAEALEQSRAEVERLRAALEMMLASARPHPELHPTMTAAWAHAREVLAAPPSTGQGREGV